MWRTGGRGSLLSQLLCRAVAASALTQPQPYEGARFRVVASATSRAFNHTFGPPLTNNGSEFPPRLTLTLCRGMWSNEMIVAVLE